MMVRRTFEVLGSQQYGSDMVLANQFPYLGRHGSTLEPHLMSSKPMLASGLVI